MASNLTYCDKDFTMKMPHVKKAMKDAKKDAKHKEKKHDEKKEHAKKKY